MISRCAHPGCGRPFKYLHEGQVFVLPVGQASQNAQRNLIEELYFLCADCKRTHTIIVREGQPVVVPLKNKNRIAPRGKEDGDAA